MQHAYTQGRVMEHICPPDEIHMGDVAQQLNDCVDLALFIREESLCDDTPRKPDADLVSAAHAALVEARKALEAVHANIFAANIGLF